MFTRFFKIKSDWSPKNTYLKWKQPFLHSSYCFKGVTGGSAHDIFTADVLYHKSCYNKFIYILLQQKRKRQQQQEEKDHKNKNEEVIRRFCRLIEQKMLNDKKAFLLIDLLGDISDLSDEEGVEPVAHLQISKKNS